MTARRLYAIIYALMVEESGDRVALEKQLEEWAVRKDFEEARVRDVVPDAVASEMRAAMSLGGGPAPLREKR